MKLTYEEKLRRAKEYGFSEVWEPDAEETYFEAINRWTRCGGDLKPEYRRRLAETVWEQIHTGGWSWLKCAISDNYLCLRDRRITMRGILFDDGRDNSNDPDFVYHHPHFSPNDFRRPYFVPSPKCDEVWDDSIYRNERSKRDELLERIRRAFSVAD